MKIEETVNCMAINVFTDYDTICMQDFTGDYVRVDKQQAGQLIEVLQRWVNGEEIE
ncbi:hypothetical protein KWC53_004500 [Salmonella enterica]|nr:hypothetical protein [Salmonella enterica]